MNRTMRWAVGLAGVGLTAFALLHDVIRAGGFELGTNQALALLAGLALMLEAGLSHREQRSSALWSRVVSDRRSGLLISLGFGLALLGIQLDAFHRLFVDDAFITFRYARHLASGLGVVWNPGQAPVEGYSNFLWMILSAIAHRLGIDPMVAARGLGGACAAASLLAVRQLAVVTSGTRAGANLTIVLMAAIPGFAYWAMSGLESASFVLLSLLYFLCFHLDLERRRLPWRTALAADLLLLSRPEAPLILVCSVVPLLAPRERDSWRWLLNLVLLALPIAAGYEAWRGLTFGRLFPNTVAAKWQPGAGAPLVLSYFRMAFPLLLLALGGLSRSASLFQRQVLVVSAAMLFALVNAAPQVGHFGRFYLPVLALLIVLVPAAYSAWDRWRVRAPAGIARSQGLAVAVLALMAIYFASPFDEMNLYAGKEVEGYRRAEIPVAELLRATCSPHALLVASDCGLVPYLSDLPTLDVWGLNDRRIAERGFDLDYVLSSRPDAVVLHSTRPDEFVGRAPYDTALYRALASAGQHRLMGRWETYGYWLWVFERKSPS